MAGANLSEQQVRLANESPDVLCSVDNNTALFYKISCFLISSLAKKPYSLPDQYSNPPALRYNP